MALTFAYTPDRGFRKNSKPTVTNAQFGSGYSQRIAVGINTLDEQWDLNFRNRSIDSINAILSFLENHKGVEYFLWTPPYETMVLRVICQEWDTEYNSEFSKSLNCTFKRVYDI